MKEAIAVNGLWVIESAAGQCLRIQPRFLPMDNAPCLQLEQDDVLQLVPVLSRWLRDRGLDPAAVLPQTCSRCRWWGNKPGEFMAPCRAHPPAVHIVDGKPESYWPETGEDDRCGAFKSVMS